jgi:hypothetical protein
VENRKVGNPVVFLWDAFWLKLQLFFFAKISHYVKFQRDRRRSGWKKGFFATQAVFWPIIIIVCVWEIFAEFLENWIGHKKFIFLTNDRELSMNGSFLHHISLRATACKNWHILGKSNSHYFLLSWNSHQIFFSLYKKYNLNIFGLKNCAPPFLQSSKSAVLQFSWKYTFFCYFI